MRPPNMAGSLPDRQPQVHVGAVVHQVFAATFSIAICSTIVSAGWFCMRLVPIELGINDDVARSSLYSLVRQLLHHHTAATSQHSVTTYKLSIAHKQPSLVVCRVISSNNGLRSLSAHPYVKAKSMTP